MYINKVRDKVSWLINNFRYSRKIPPKVILLITIPRSGSTWLFDLLRAHPAIEVYPSSVIWEAMGCRGRRYPRDLSQGNDARLNIEVEKGNWEKIPDFTVTNDNLQYVQNILENTWFIEKIHPHFLNANRENFVERIKILRNKTQVNLVYHIRPPQETTSSFIDYQKRNQNWYPKVNNKELLKHMKSEYQFILDVSQELNGTVTTYSELKENTHKIIRKLLDKLGLSYSYLFKTDGYASSLIEAMEKSTLREVRINSHTRNTFLGTKESEYQDTLDFQKFLDNNQAEIQEIVSLYQSILEMKQ